MADVPLRGPNSMRVVAALLQIVFEVGPTDEASVLGLERLEAFGGESFIDIPTSPREGVYRAAENEFDAPVIVFGR